MQLTTRHTCAAAAERLALLLWQRLGQPHSPCLVLHAIGLLALGVSPRIWVEAAVGLACMHTLAVSAPCGRVQPVQPLTVACECAPDQATSGMHVHLRGPYLDLPHTI